MKNYPLRPGTRPTSPLPLLALIAASPATLGQSDPPIPPEPPIIQLRPILVTGQLLPSETWEAAAPLNRLSLTPSVEGIARHPDAASLLEGIPGAAVLRNGTLTGIVQLRGLQNERVRVLVDGMTLSPACPNHMDPPLHYASPSAIQNLTVLAGITPVSVGGDSIAGTVIVDPAPPRFHTNDAWHAFGEIGATVRTASDGLSLHGGAGAATDAFSTAYHGTWQTADDYRFPDGRALDTGYDTQSHDIRVATRTDRTLWGADLGFVRTRDAGTPSLPMDMIEDDAWRVGLRHEADYDFGRVLARLYRNETDHLMDNYSLRPPGMMRMSSPAQSDDTGIRAALNLPHEIHTLGLGAEYHRNDFDAFQRNDGNGLRQDTINEADRNRAGAFAEWTALWSDRWETRAGVRLDGVWMAAGAVEAWFAPSAADATRFNNADRDHSDVAVDGVLSARHRATEWLTIELAAARKNRAPTLLERYLWTPLSASAGQADGRTYLGNLELDPETSHQVACTALFHGTQWQVGFTPFYHWVSDYIQGTPITRLDSTGRPVLQYQNVDLATLYGIDAHAEWTFLTPFTVAGTLSYVRGRNEDTSDNLYRIAPLRGTLALEATLENWTAGIEGVFAGAQDNVAAYNGESPSPSYALLNLRLGYRFNHHLDLLIGVDNVLDEAYADHLSGVNRVTQSDVAVGQRLPGVGRACHVTAQYRF